MNNYSITTGSEEDFFARGREWAKLADQAAPIPEGWRISFEDVAEMPIPPVIPAATQRKDFTSLSLPPEILAYFKASGPDWQNRIADVLRAWMEAHPQT